MNQSSLLYCRSGHQGLPIDSKGMMRSFKIACATGVPTDDARENPPALPSWVGQLFIDRPVPKTEAADFFAF